MTKNAVIDERDDVDVPVSLDRTTYELVIELDNYIAQPYWPEKNQVIELDKRSGKRGPGRAGDAARQEKLEAFLAKEGITLDDYNKLVERSNRAWRRVDDDDVNSPIIIAPEQFTAFLANVVALSATRSIRGPIDRQSVRALVRVTKPGLITNKLKADRVWGRFAKLEQSNQRSWQESEVIENVTAKGTLSIPADMDVRDLEAVIKWGLDRVGIGASRPMGYGRGRLISLA